MDNDLRLLSMQRIKLFADRLADRSNVAASLNASSVESIAVQIGVMPNPKDSYIRRIDEALPWTIGNLQWGPRPTPKEQPKDRFPFSPTARCPRCKSYRSTTLSCYRANGTRSHKCIKCQYLWKTAMLELDAPTALPALIHIAPKRKPTGGWKKYEYGGETRTLAQWSRKTGISYSTLYTRLRSGWSVDEALTIPARTQSTPNRNTYTYCGADLTLRELAELTGVNRDTIVYRLERGLSVEEAVHPGRMMHATHKHAKRIEHNGVARTLREWSAVTGIAYQAIRSRISLGWDIDRVLTTPVGTRMIEHNGEKKTIREWATYSGIRESTLRARLSDGWDIGLALQQKPQRRGISHKDARMIEHDGKSLSVRELANRTGRGVSTIYRYLSKGWDIASALSHREPAVHQIEFGGECLTTREWSSRTGITRTAIVWRIKAGWSAERILTTPVSKGNRLHKDGERVDGNAE